jgi:hypothetical protein
MQKFENGRVGFLWSKRVCLSGPFLLKLLFGTDIARIEINQTQHIQTEPVCVVERHSLKISQNRVACSYLTDWY